MSKATLYDILGVAPQSESVVIQAAYKAMIMKYHPDRYEGDPETAEQKARELNHAILILGDPARRASYDAELRRERGNVTFPGRAAEVATAGPVAFATGSPGWVPDWSPKRGRPRKGIAPRLGIGVAAMAAAVLAGHLLSSDQGEESENERRRGTTTVAVPPATPPDLNGDQVRLGVGELKEILSGAVTAKVREYSQSCLKAVRKRRSWEKADFCFGFDAAASITDRRQGTLPYTYFGKGATEKRFRAVLVDGFGISEEAAMRRIDMVWDRAGAALDKPLPEAPLRESRSINPRFTGVAEIPAAFWGNWASSSAGCAPGARERIAIAPSDIGLFDRHGRVDTVTPVNGNDQYAVRVTMADKGEAWDDQFTLGFRPGSGSNRLILSSETSGTREYRRC